MGKDYTGYRWLDEGNKAFSIRMHEKLQKWVSVRDGHVDKDYVCSYTDAHLDGLIAQKIIGPPQTPNLKGRVYKRDGFRPSTVVDRIADCDLASFDLPLSLKSAHPNDYVVRYHDGTYGWSEASYILKYLVADDHDLPGKWFILGNGKTKYRVTEKLTDRNIGFYNASELIALKINGWGCDDGYGTEKGWQDEEFIRKNLCSPPEGYKFAAARPIVAPSVPVVVPTQEKPKHTFNPYVTKGLVVCQDCGLVEAATAYLSVCKEPNTRRYATAQEARFIEFADAHNQARADMVEDCAEKKQPFSFGMRTGFSALDYSMRLK